jgi:alkanesulfonate monooxygenase SsuD/methylene tetrahydromethanopterin reductase-like flavin-dependent oxidoreductase (luciferase family)
MAAATVDDLSGHRFVLGLGSSHRVQVVPEHGIEYARPLARVRETVAVVRALLRDGTVEHAGETISIERFDLWFRPTRPTLPIYLSALFPRMLSLAGEVGDGVILTRSTLGTAAAVRPAIAQGATLANRDPEASVLTSLLPTSIAESRAEALAAMRPGLAFYAGFFPR